MRLELDRTSAHKALASLGRAIVRSKEAPEDEELRDAVILRFAFTFELAWKALKRQLGQEVAEPASVDRLAFQDLLREAAERGLLADVEAWMEYRRQRNITTHTYGRDKGQERLRDGPEVFPGRPNTGRENRRQKPCLTLSRDILRKCGAS